MNIKIKFRKVGGEDTWEEIYDTRGADPGTLAERLVNNFNNTLRSHEHPIELVSWTETEEKGTRIRVPHDWSKTSLMTEAGGYDKMKCRKCGITGKRHELGSGVRRDPKFKHARFSDCDDAKAYLEKRREAKTRKDRVVNIHWGRSNAE